MGTYCEDLLDYFNRELRGAEQVDFDNHLSKCGGCREEFLLLREALHFLQFDFAVQKVPASLKEEVLGFVYGD